MLSEPYAQRMPTVKRQSVVCDSHRVVRGETHDRSFTSTDQSLVRAPSMAEVSASR
jgi:hypothetical protein